MAQVNATFRTTFLPGTWRLCYRQAFGGFGWEQVGDPFAVSDKIPSYVALDFPIPMPPSMQTGVSRTWPLPCERAGNSKTQVKGEKNVYTNACSARVCTCALARVCVPAQLAPAASQQTPGAAPARGWPPFPSGCAGSAPPLPPAWGAPPWPRACPRLAARSGPPSAPSASWSARSGAFPRQGRRGAVAVRPPQPGLGTPQGKPRGSQHRSSPSARRCFCCQGKFFQKKLRSLRHFLSFF